MFKREVPPDDLKHRPEVKFFFSIWLGSLKEQSFLPTNPNFFVLKALYKNFSRDRLFAPSLSSCHFCYKLAVISISTFSPKRLGRLSPFKFHLIVPEMRYKILLNTKYACWWTWSYRDQKVKNDDKYRCKKRGIFLVFVLL